jgi:hypothetical protein
MRKDKIRAKVSEKTRADFQPHIEIPQDRKTLFYWDGIVYNGHCVVDGRRCYFTWLEDLIESIGEWEKFQFTLTNGDEYLSVCRDLNGVHVYGCYVMTQEQCDHVDGSHNMYNISPFRGVRNQELVGYWFVDGLEIAEDTFFHGTIDNLEKLTKEEIDFIDSIPLVA